MKNQLDTFRDGTKTAALLTLLQSSKGATLAQLVKATGWQRHTVRGMLANLKKRRKLAIEASKNRDGTIVYRLSQSG